MPSLDHPAPAAWARLRRKIMIPRQAAGSSGEPVNVLAEVSAWLLQADSERPWQSTRPHDCGRVAAGESRTPSLSS